MTTKGQRTTGHGGAREGSGRKTFFPGKVRKPVSVSLTQEGHELLQRAGRRLAASHSDVIEGLLRQYSTALELRGVTPGAAGTARREAKTSPSAGAPRFQGGPVSRAR